MPFKVKEHFRKTKKGGLSRVKESTRKDRVKKGLIVAGTALTTLGLGALAYKKLGSKLVKGAVSVSGKADDVAASKAKDITALVTPEKLTTKAKSYQTLPDPWLDGSTTANKAKKIVTTGKKETKLLTGSKYKAENISDPWDSKVKKPILSRKQRRLTTTTESKEKVLLLKKGSYDAPDYISPTPSSNVTGKGKDLGAEIRSQRTLVKREPTDIKKANERLELANKYKNSNSPSLQQTGANYERAANQRLTIIAKRQVNKKQTGLVTTRGNASKSSVRHPGDLVGKKPSSLKTEPPLSQTTRIPNTNTEDTGKLVTSRRTVLRGLLFGGKQAITKAPKQVADKAKRSLMDTIGDAKWIDDNIQEIGKKGKNVYKRSIVLSKAKNKLVNKAGYELNKSKEGLGQAIDIATLPGRARRTNRTIKRQSAVIVKQAKKARAALGDPAEYHRLTTGERLNAGAKIIRLLGG